MLEKLQPVHSAEQGSFDVAGSTAAQPSPCCTVHSPGDIKGPEDQPSSASLSVYDFGQVTPPQFTHV